jgi:hypothetical protein
MTKKLNRQNWLEQDVSLVSREPLCSQDWAEQVLRPQLAAGVPHSVRRLFDGARGALIYGYFYYALCMMGAVALFRVGEAALAVKRSELEQGTTPRRPSFDDDLQWLASQGVVQSADWQRIAAARNSMAYLPSEDVLPLLEQVVAQLNALFAAPPG